MNKIEYIKLRIWEEQEKLRIISQAKDHWHNPWELKYEYYKTNKLIDGLQDKLEELKSLPDQCKECGLLHSNDITCEENIRPKDENQKNQESNNR